VSQFQVQGERVDVDFVITSYHYISAYGTSNGMKRFGDMIDMLVWNFASVMKQFPYEVTKVSTFSIDHNGKIAEPSASPMSVSASIATETNRHLQRLMRSFRKQNVDEALDEIARRYELLDKDYKISVSDNGFVVLNPR